MRLRSGWFYPTWNGSAPSWMYWTDGTLHAALTEADQRELIVKVTNGDDGALFRFGSVPAETDRLKALMVAYLNRLRGQDLQQLISKFIYRDLQGENAQDVLPTMAAAYRLLRGHAAYDGGVVHVLGRRSWPFLKGRLMVSHVFMPLSAVSDVRGTVGDFVVSTDLMSIRFAEGGLFVVPLGSERLAENLLGEDPLQVPVPSV